MNKFVASTLAAVAVVLAAASPAGAAIKYHLTALSSYAGSTGSFTYTSPDFITDVRRIDPLPELDSFVIVASGSQILGLRQTIEFEPVQAGTLVVSQAGAVPEPTSRALMIWLRDG